MNFWQKILAEKKMILALSPMDGVSDFPFRSIGKKYGQMDVVFSEFANVEGICRSSSSRILDHFDFDGMERPFVAQIFGKTPSFFKQAAVLLCELGVEGIDINMGCPAPTVANHGSGAAIIKNPSLAKEIIKAVQDGVREWSEGLELKDCIDISSKMLIGVTEKKKKFSLIDVDRKKIPTISVKTRIGYHEEEIETWLPHLIEMRLAAISLHGRTLKQGYSGKADWSVIGRAATLIKEADPSVTFLGNGDVLDYEEAKQKVEEFGVDGVLIGRSSFGKPFVFLPKEERSKFLTEQNIFKVALEHAKLYEQTYPETEGYRFLPMRKHLAWYTKGIEQAAVIRSELVRSNNSLEVEQILKKHNLI
jgi:nifR3 family TIM-barrel protein